MLVKNWMSKKVTTINVNNSMIDAIQKLKENHISMLPVMKKDKLIGIITDRDLKKASASDATTLEVHELLYIISNIKIKDLMTKDPVTVPPDFTIGETAELLLEKNISGVPVLSKKNEVAGVITKADIFSALISLTGLKSRGGTVCL